jgi:Ala-tRNA(Pro) deacylase
MKSRADLMQHLSELGIETTTLDHPPVFTVAQSAELDRTLPGGHTKNLFLKSAKGELYLVVAHAHTRVDLKHLAKRLAAGRLSFGNPGLLLESLGVTPGSVTVFSLVNDAGRRVNVILDEALMAFEIINGHPLENTATTSIAHHDLLRFIRACGHEPLVLYLGSEPSPPPA